MSNTSWTLYAHEVTLKRDQFMKTIAWLEAVRKDWKFIYNILFTYWTYAILSSFKVLTKTGMRSSFKVSKRILRLRRQVCMNASLLFVLLFFVKGATSSFSHKLLWNAFIEISNRTIRDTKCLSSFNNTTNAETPIGRVGQLIRPNTVGKCILGNVRDSLLISNKIIQEARIKALVSIP